MSSLLILVSAGKKFAAPLLVVVLVGKLAGAFHVYVALPDPPEPAGPLKQISKASNEWNDWLMK